MINASDQIYPIGIGTFGLGANPTESGAVEIHKNQDEEMAALIYGFEHGQNYIEASHHYAEGETLKFLAKFLKKIPRDQVFVTAKLFKPFATKRDVEEQIDLIFRELGVDYVDSLSCIPITFSGEMPIEEVYELAKTQLAAGKTRFLGGSNLNLEKLDRLKAIGIDLFVMEGLYNLECKYNEDNGVLKYCNDHGILFAAYQPLRRNRTAMRHYPVVDQLASKYKRTPNQVILNWITKHKKLFALIRSGNVGHLQQNLAALDFEMSGSEYLELDAFRSPEFDAIKIDWDNKGGVLINKVASMLP